MSAATAPITDVSRTDVSATDDNRPWNKAGQPKAQCTPMPLPALGTQRIIQGNGTNVGTVISLQCPERHRLVGSEMMCVMGTNSTLWVGDTYCKPLSSYEENGFRVAVLASIVSSAIILLMSVAFITCCLVDCIKEEKRKKEERMSDLWQWEEEAQYQEDNRSRYSHKGRNNNNNNNSQEKVLSFWETSNSAMCDGMQNCRCHQHHTYDPALVFGHSPLVSALPGQEYDQPPPSESAQAEGPPPQYLGPSQSFYQTTSPSRVHLPAAGSSLVWQSEGQDSSLSRVNPSKKDESNTWNTNPSKEGSIRIISV